MDGNVTAKKSRRPLILVYYEACIEKKKTIEREKYFKTSKGKTTLKLMLKSYLE